MDSSVHGVPSQSQHGQRTLESCLQLRIISLYSKVCHENIIICDIIWTNLEEVAKYISPTHFHICLNNQVLFCDRFCSLFKTGSSVISFHLTLFISITTWFCNFVAFNIEPKCMSLEGRKNTFESYIWSCGL
jgi:hypothetical protein